MPTIRNGRGSVVSLTGHTETHVYYFFADDPARIERVSSIRDALNYWSIVPGPGDERFVDRPRVAFLRHFILTSKARENRAKKAKKGRFSV